MTDADEGVLGALLERQRSAFLLQGAPSLEQRRDDLKRLKEAVKSFRGRFVMAADGDFGHRSRHETSLLDLMPVVACINYLRRNLARWMRPERRHVALHFMPGASRVVYQPLGVVGIVSPWNYPVSLALVPLATALAAGNRAMLKPSEFIPATSALMAAMLGEIFAEDQVAVVCGDADVAAAFSRLPFDHLLLTGSTRVGRTVMRAASDNLVPVTLELGGKSPAIIERGFALAEAARRIAYGKLANAGQTCIAPDYVLAPEDEVERFVAAYAAAVSTLYPDIGSNPDYTSIVNDRQHKRLAAMLADARAKGARIVELGGVGAGRTLTHARTFLPVVATGVSDAMSMMQEEIFGPILPVVPYRSLDEAIAYVNARPRPLALYFFGADGPGRQSVLARTTSGGVTINDTLLHYGQDDLPFGGVGDSGMGAYHGREGFRRLSHAKAVFVQSKLNLTDLARPPFGRRFDWLVDFLMR